MNQKEYIRINDRLVGLADLEQRLNEQDTPEWEKKNLLFIVDWFNSNDFIKQKTSGSTGEPKEIELKKTAMIASATSTIKFFGLKPGDSAWLCLPVDYIAGKMIIVRAIVGQLNLIITEPTSVPLIPAIPVDFTAMVPLQVKKMIDSNVDFSSIKKIIIGGAAVDALLEQRLQSFSTDFYATYGMTETCSHIALQPLNGPHRTDCFKLLPGVSVSANNDNCLVIDAPDLLPKTLVTTDIVKIISPTKFRIIGRADNVINSGGIKISPEELESIISPLIDNRFIVCGKKDIDLGQKLILAIEGSPDKSIENLLSEIRIKVGSHRTPKDIVFIEKFPVNASMKIDRKQIELLINSME